MCFRIVFSSTSTFKLYKLKYLHDQHKSNTTLREKSETRIEQSFSYDERKKTKKSEISKLSENPEEKNLCHFKLSLGECSDVDVSSHPSTPQSHDLEQWELLGSRINVVSILSRYARPPRLRLTDDMQTLIKFLSFSPEISCFFQNSLSFCWSFN